MRSAAVALAASALLMGAEAGSLFRRHAHHNVHKRNYGYEAPAAQDAETCKIVTYTTWVEYNRKYSILRSHSCYLVPVPIPTPLHIVPSFLPSFG